MKVTTIIADEMIQEAMKYAETKTVTDTLKVALSTYIAAQKIKEMSSYVLLEPLEFKYSAKELRGKNNL